MAYITTERVAEIRKELKAEFSNIKFSVVREHYSSVNISIMAAPFRFTERDYEPISFYNLDKYENSEILNRIFQIANKGNHDRSDSQSDYFDVGFYLNIRVGKYDQPFQLIEPKAEKIKKVKPAVVKAEPKRTFFQSLTAILTF